MAHNCPPYCHHCPDMDGDVMPACWGVVTNPEAGLRACHCVVERECAQEGARRLLESRFVPPALRAELETFVKSSMPGRPNPVAR